MPQLEVATFYSQIFWLIICLATLYISLRYIFVPRIESSIVERNKRIESMIQDAEKMQTEADLLTKEYTALIRKAHFDSSELHKKEIKEFEERCDLRLEKLSIEHNKKLDLITQDLVRLKDEFMDDLESKTKILLTDLLNKILPHKKAGDQ